MTDITNQHQAGETPAEKNEAGVVWGAIIVLLALWAASITFLGVPGIFLPALVLVPIIMAVIVLFTWG